MFKKLKRWRQKTAISAVVHPEISIQLAASIVSLFSRKEETDTEALRGGSASQWITLWISPDEQTEIAIISQNPNFNADEVSLDELLESMRPTNALAELH